MYFDTSDVTAWYSQRRTESERSCELDDADGVEQGVHYILESLELVADLMQPCYAACLMALCR